MPTPTQSKQIPSETAVWQDHTARLSRQDVDWLQRHTLAAVEHVGLPAGSSVRIAVVADAEMTAMHNRCMGINETTDVLTFDLRDRSAGEAGQALPLDTDIMVCLDEAARQVAGRGLDPTAVRRELLLYAVHGILHCLDHDDHDEADFDRMHAAEDEILKAIGVGPVFHPHA